MRDNIAAELMNLKKRTMDEMITYFNDVVSEMNIPCKDKMTLLGMITAIGYEAQNVADVVPVGAYNQAAWERDTAIEQLKQIGKSFGEKMDDVRPVVRGGVD